MITVLTGDNDYAVSRAVKQFVQGFEGEVERYEGTELELAQLPDICSGMTLFASERLIVISTLSENKTLWVELEVWLEKVPETTHLVLIEPKVDKRTRTYKSLTKRAEVREHKSLDTLELVEWLRTLAREQETDLARDEARYLVEYVGHDQWRLSSELHKLLLSEQPITRELIHRVCEPYPEASAFELLDSLFAGKSERAEQLLELLAEREDPYKFLGLLSSQLMSLLVITSAGQRSNNEIARDSGVHPYVIQKLTPVAKRLGQKEVVRAIDQLATCDARIKTSGVEPWDQLRRTLLTMG